MLHHVGQQPGWYHPVTAVKQNTNWRSISRYSPDCTVSFAEKQVSVLLVMNSSTPDINLGSCSVMFTWHSSVQLHIKQHCVCVPHHHCYLNSCHVWPMHTSTDMWFSGISHFFKFAICFITELNSGNSSTLQIWHNTHCITIITLLKQSVCHSTHFTYSYSLVIIFTLQKKKHISSEYCTAQSLLLWIYNITCVLLTVLFLESCALLCIQMDHCVLHSDTFPVWDFRQQVCLEHL